MLLINLCMLEIGFNEICSIISIILGILSIAISIILYKISNQTSKQLAENAAKLAITYSEKSNTSNSKIELSHKQYKKLKKQINKLYRVAKKNSINEPWIKAAVIPISLKCVLSEDKTIDLMKKWKENEFVTWEKTLEVSTKVFIKNKEGIIESISTCQS